MAELEIREIYGVDALPYHRLATACFHAPKAELTDPEKAAEFAVEHDKQWDRETVNGVRYRRVAMFDGERLAANIDIRPALVNFDGNNVICGHIGAVCSEPELRRGGGVRKVFARVMEIMKEEGMVVSNLDPFTANFYRKFGYEVACERVYWAIPTEYLPAYSNKGIVRFEGTEKQKEDIQKVWSIWTAELNLSEVRTAYKWEKWFNAHAPYSSDYYGYLHYNEAGEVDGFLSYQTLFDGPQPMAMDCESGAFWYTGPEGLQALLAYAAGMKDYAREVRLCLPGNADLMPLVEYIGGWGRKLVTRRTVVDGTFRIVDAKKALELAAYRGSGKVCIGLTDPTCPWNTGAWTVEFENGKATSVEAGGTPDIELTEKAFGPLLMGRGGLNQAKYHPGTVIHGNQENLEKVFYTKTVFTQAHY